MIELVTSDAGVVTYTEFDVQNRIILYTHTECEPWETASHPAVLPVLNIMG